MMLNVSVTNRPNLFDLKMQSLISKKHTALIVNDVYQENSQPSVHRESRYRSEIFISLTTYLLQ